MDNYAATPTQKAENLSDIVSLHTPTIGSTDCNHQEYLGIETLSFNDRLAPPPMVSDDLWLQQQIFLKFLRASMPTLAEVARQKKKERCKAICEGMKQGTIKVVFMKTVKKHPTKTTNETN